MIKRFLPGGNPAGERLAMASLGGERSAVLGTVKDAARRLRRYRRVRVGILDRACAQRSGGRQVGTKGWPMRSNKGMAACRSGGDALRVMIGIEEGSLAEHAAGDRQQ